MNKDNGRLYLIKTPISRGDPIFGVILDEFSVVKKYVEKTINLEIFINHLFF
jgi:hypothetical protein